MSRVFKVDYIPDPDRGRPLWNAKIFVGVANQDPTIPSNQIQLTGDIGFPVGQSIPVPQPVRTNAGGITVYNKSPLDLNAPGQEYAIQIFDRNDNLIYNFPQVDGSVVMNTTSQEEVTGLTIWPEVGEAVIGQTIPAGTDAIRYPFNGRSTLFTIKPPVAVAGTITNITINSSGIGELEVDNSDVYDLAEFNSFIAANDGDSQLAGGNIWPLSSQESAQAGDDLTGYEFVRLQGGDFTDIELFQPIYQDNPNDEITGTLDSFDLSTPPYSGVIGGDAVYFRVYKYSRKGKFTWREFGAKSGASIDPTENANAIQACFRTSYLSAVQSGFRLDTIKIEAGTGLFRASPNIILANNNAGTFNVEGAGYDKTTLSLVVASPSDSEFLFNNQNSWAFTTFTGFTFESEGNNGNIYYSETSGTVQSISFVECRFRRFNGAIWLGPTVQNSEYNFTRCRFNDCANAEYVMRVENPQAVNNRFYSTDVQDFQAAGFQFKTGGTIYFSQGSIIPQGNGRVIDIPADADEASSGDNNPTMVFDGTRFEFRDDSQMLRKLNDVFFTHIVWNGCGMGGQNMINGQFPIQYGGNAVFTMEDCENLSNWKINYVNEGNSSRQSNWRIDNCSLPATFISDSIFSILTTPTNVARAPLFDIRNNEREPGLNGVFRPNGGYLGPQQKISQTFSFLVEDKKLAAGVSTFEETLFLHPGRFTKIEFVNFSTNLYGATNATINIYNDNKSQLIASRTYQVDTFGSEVIYVDYRLPSTDNLRIEFSNDFPDQTINYTYFGEILITN